MPFVEADPPFSAEIVSPTPRDPILFPHGQLITREHSYWQGVREHAQQEEDDGLEALAASLEKGFLTLAMGRLAIEQARAIPGALTTANPSVVRWYDNTVTHLGSSRLLRSLRIMGNLVHLDAESEEELDEDLPPLETGIEVLGRGEGIARVAIHASEELLGSRGLTPLVRNGSTWFKHPEMGIYVEVSNPADSASPSFRKTFRRANRRRYEAGEHFTVQPHIMLSTWARVYRGS